MPLPSLPRAATSRSVLVLLHGANLDGLPRAVTNLLAGSPFRKQGLRLSSARHNGVVLAQLVTGREVYDSICRKHGWEKKYGVATQHS